MAVKVGFIGTGGISRPHRKHLKNMDDVEVVAMCDLEKDRVAEAAEKGIDIFTKDMNIEYRERRSITIIQGGNSELVEVQNDFWQDMDNDFIDAVRKGDDSALKTTYADAVKTQEVVMAVNRSIETGEVVQISDM